MKILFIRANCEHPNEMHINNVKAFLEVSDVTFYGPGYTEETVLKNGVKWFWEKNNGFDAVIVDFFIALLQLDYLDLAWVYQWHRYYLSDFEIREAIQYADNIINEVSDLDTVKILQYIYDLDRFPDHWRKCAESLLNKGYYFWGAGTEFFPSFEENDIYVKAGFSNNYRLFSIENREHIISVPTYTADIREFYGRPLCEREYDITVPGSLDVLTYPNRIKIMDSIRRSHLSSYEDYSNREVAYRQNNDRVKHTEYVSEEDRVLDTLLDERCIYMNAQLSRDSHSIWKEKYNTGLRKCKTAYADGGFDNQIVRKHMEICARGTVLLCQKTEPLKHYGFANEVNMVEVTSEDVVMKTEYLLAHLDRAQEIAIKAQKMVLKKHSPVMHANLIIESVERIKENSFSGSEWKNGEYIIHS